MNRSLAITVIFMVILILACAGDLYDRNERRAGFYLPVSIDEWVYFPDW